MIGAFILQVPFSAFCELVDRMQSGNVLFVTLAFVARSVFDPVVPPRRWGHPCRDPGGKGISVVIAPPSCSAGRMAHLEVNDIRFKQSAFCPGMAGGAQQDKLSRLRRLFIELLNEELGT